MVVIIIVLFFVSVSDWKNQKTKDGKKKKGKKGKAGQEDGKHCSKLFAEIVTMKVTL